MVSIARGPVSSLGPHGTRTRPLLSFGAKVLDNKHRQTKSSQRPPTQKILQKNRKYFAQTGRIRTLTLVISTVAVA